MAGILRADVTFCKDGAIHPPEAVLNMTRLTYPQLHRALQDLEAAGSRATLLGVGPMSRRIVRAALELAQERDFPLLFIASRNQVDTRRVGGGYVAGWDQAAFVDAIRRIAGEIGFSGLYYVCRDHGGPWHRDEELRAAIGLEQAMASARRSYLEDLVQGFDLLHIDPTRDPHRDSGVPIAEVITRSVELIEYVERERRSRSLPEVAYEAGTEETDGGLTTTGAYQSFIESLNAELRRRHLPAPVFVVGQTGTLVRLTENVGRFDMAAAAALAAAARGHGAGLKEHNADYLEDRALLHHPLLRVSAANVAPEFGVEESRAYLALAGAEEEQRAAGRIAESSGFLPTFTGRAVASERWRKWMTGADAELSVEAALQDRERAIRLAEICGHYVFHDSGVQEATDRLFTNLSAVGGDPEAYVLGRIKASIARYVDCFNLGGLTSRLRAAARA